MPDAVTEWVDRFSDALGRRDVAAAAGLFGADSYWRDLVAFSWNITTVEGRAGITDLLAATLERTDPREFRVTEPPTRSRGVTQAWLEFRTSAGRGAGFLRLRDDGGAWTLLTTLEELDGREEPIGARRPHGEGYAADHGRTWLADRDRARAELGTSRQPEVLIVGGGQGGIALGARLRHLGVPTVIVERNARPGDSWRRRYKTLALHDPVWFDHLPYLDFPRTWPVFASKDQMGDWLESYVTVMDLDYWGSTTATAARYDEAAGEWAVDLDRGGEQVTLRPKQLVLALGISGKPNVPAFPGADRFRGEQHHSSVHSGPDGWAGRRAVVIGSNNSAHDIAAALCNGGADVTMVQRSSTHVVRQQSMMDVAMAGLYSEAAVEAGITTWRADMLFASWPYTLLPAVQRRIYDTIRDRDADFYARLEKAGFLLDFGEDDSGMYMKYLRRGSGYYIDTGASQLIIDAAIRLAHGEIAELTEDEVVLTDGTRLPADLVVYATGYGPMNEFVADLISPEAAARVGRVWGIGSDTARDPGPWEGEERNMWKPTAQPALWFHGGGLQQARFYSRYLALQLTARAAGIPTPVYGLAPVHHAS
jgi:putative flavoprotein involved in K+ transport